MDVLQIEIEIMNIKQQREIYKLRLVLHTITDTSFAYSRLNKSHPIDAITEESADQLIEAYRELIQSVSNSIDSYENA